MNSSVVWESISPCAIMARGGSYSGFVRMGIAAKRDLYCKINFWQLYYGEFFTDELTNWLLQLRSGSGVVPRL